MGGEIFLRIHFLFLLFLLHYQLAAADVGCLFFPSNVLYFRRSYGWFWDGLHVLSQASIPVCMINTPSV